MTMMLDLCVCSFLLVTQPPFEGWKPPKLHQPITWPSLVQTDCTALSDRDLRPAGSSRDPKHDDQEPITSPLLENGTLPNVFGLELELESDVELDLRNEDKMR